jgi:hypothetical protein
MNDFQMSFLSNDLRNDRLAEASRERLGRSARQASTRSRSVKPRTTRRLSLLFGRASA